MVKKEFARPAIVLWETGNGVFQVPDANKKLDEPHPDILKKLKKKRKSEPNLILIW